MRSLLKKPLLVIGVLVLFDQLTKYLVRTRLSFGESVPVTPFINLTYVTNTGIAFSMLQGANTVLIVFATLVLAGFYFWYKRNKDALTAGMTIAAILIVSGALGNLIDRISFGQVTDFIDVAIGSYHWPAFNVADSCISVGGAMLFFYLFTSPPQRQ